MATLDELENSMRWGLVAISQGFDKLNRPADAQFLTTNP